jgi:hypothetical protein
VLPAARQLLLSKSAIGIFAAVLLAFAAPCAIAQHGGGGHVGGGGGMHSAPAPHVSAPPARSAPPPHPSASRPVVSPPPATNPANERPLTNRFIPPDAPASAYQTGQGNRPPGMALFGDGHELWLGGASGVGRPGVDLHRRIFPIPRRPIYPPVFYPVFGFPWFGSGFGLGFGLGSCDPFWGWSFTCNDFLYGGYGDGSYGPDEFAPPLYVGPAEPDYIPVPPDNNTAGEQDEAVLYLKDGTVFLISEYWLENNQIHYVSGDGIEHIIDLDSVDLQKTVDVNAKRGVAFTLRPAPDSNSEPGQVPAQPPAQAPDGNPQ